MSTSIRAKTIENINELSANLIELMHKNRISEAELARRTNIPQPTLHKILAGKTEDPRYSTLQQLASFFNLSVDELVRGITASLQNSEIKVHSLPILTWQDCIQGNDFISTLSTKIWQNWLSIENAPVNGFCIRTTASTESRFPRGTVLIVNPALRPKDGDLVILKYQNAEEAALRELLIDGPNKFLLPISLNSTKEIFTDFMKIIGVVVEYRFSYV